VRTPGGLLMGDEAHTAARHRGRAEQLRAIAEDEACPPKTRETLTRMIEDYERMAENLEAIDRANRGRSSKS
jgi:hypothetical protein